MTKLEFFTLNALAQLRATAMTGVKMFNVNSDLIYAQAILESGNFKSKIYVENFNIFGLKHPVKRLSVSLGSNRGHARYKSYYDCITDYYLRQINFKVKDTSDPDEYLNELHRTGYAEDKNYLAKIKAIYNQNIQNA